MSPADEIRLLRRELVRAIADRVTLEIEVRRLRSVIRANRP